MCPHPKTLAPKSNALSTEQKGNPDRMDLHEESGMTHFTSVREIQVHGHYSRNSESVRSSSGTAPSLARATLALLYE